MMKNMVKAVLMDWELTWSRTDCSVLRKLFDTIVEIPFAILGIPIMTIIGIVAAVKKVNRMTESDWDEANSVGTEKYWKNYADNFFSNN